MVQPATQKKRRTFTLDDNDHDLLTRLKGRGIDYSETVRRGLLLLRRLESNSHRGFTRLLLEAEDGAHMYLDDVKEFIPGG